LSFKLKVFFNIKAITFLMVINFLPSWLLLRSQ